LRAHFTLSLKRIPVEDARVYDVLMRVLVLGGTGFIGTHIVRALLGAGHEVTIFRREPNSVDLPRNVSAIFGDRNRLEASATEFRNLRPDVVVDVIAYTEEQGKDLTARFNGIAKRAVVLSSSDVYRANDLFFGLVSGPSEPTPLKECSPLRERLYPCRGVPFPNINGFSWNDYDKLLVERVVASNLEMPTTVLRLPMVYGPGAYDMRKRRFWPYWKRMEDGRNAILLDQRTARWRACWGYVEDMAEAVRLAVESERWAGQIYNVAEADRLDIQDWLREISNVLAWRGKIVVIDEECPEPSLPRSLNLDQHLDIDASKIRRELGYKEIVSRHDALERCIAWERTHPPSQVNPALFDYAAEDVILSRVQSAA
jgi:nucleoside-diphosphate-sugar epimerase